MSAQVADLVIDLRLLFVMTLVGTIEFMVFPQFTCYILMTFTEKKDANQYIGTESAAGTPLCSSWRAKS